jgi:hypothetical protein
MEMNALSSVTRTTAPLFLISVLILSSSLAELQYNFFTPDKSRDFSLLQRVHTGSWFYSATYTISVRRSFSGGLKVTTPIFL